MILGTTIQNRLKPHFENYFDFDIRYLDRWINSYPNLFPKFMKDKKFEAKFIWNKDFTDFRWEIHKTN
jgi:hypothetical protein